MDHQTHRTADDPLEQLSRGLLRWVLGSGLLSLHVGVYLVTVVGMLLWNFARTPNDIWVDGPLRRWGLVVVFHTTAFAVGWTAWRLMHLGESPSTPARRTAPVRSVATTAMGAPGQMVVAAGSTPTAPVVMPASAGTRRWFRESIRLAREAVGSGAPAPNGPAAASTVAGPGITEWGVAIVRRTRSMVFPTRGQSAQVGGSRNGTLNGSSNGHAAGLAADPANSWPAGVAPGALPLPEPLVPDAGNATWPAAPNETMASYSDFTVSNGHTEGTNGHTAYEFVPEVPLDQAQTESPMSPAVDPAAAEDARWTWVESAAAAWMSRRELDDEAETTLAPAPPPPVDDPTTNP